VGAVAVAVPTGTDLDEYRQWEAATGGIGIGDLVYDDPDDATDAAEFRELSGSTTEPVTE
jgi:hypothetical protein